MDGERYVTMNEEGLAEMNRLWDAFNALEKITKELLPVSRETSLFVTKLEEAFMWATKALAVKGAVKNEIS